MPDDRIIQLQDRMDADWQAGLARKGQQSTIVGDERNVLQALRTAPELRGLIRFDQFSLNVELTRDPPWRRVQPSNRWTDDDDTALMSLLQDRGIAVRGKNVVADCVSLVAKDQCVHPVKEYLAGLQWDGVERLSGWLVRNMGATGDAAYLSAISRCWLISAVARVETPGCQADHALVLESPQGEGKSSAARILAVRSEWFADSIGDLGNKDSALQLSGKWIVELAELASIRRAEIESVKSYLSRTQDTFRPPYGRRAVTVPRQTVFIGSTNERSYLRDRTGNRRFWPVSCERIDLNALERDRDQLWAEAAEAYRAGEAWHLTGDLAALAAAEQENRLFQTELDSDVAEFLDLMAEQGRTEITTREVFAGALNMNPHSEKYAEQAVKLGVQVAGAIEKSGWTRVGTRGRATTKRTVYRLTKIHQENLHTLRARANIGMGEKNPVNLGEPFEFTAGCPDCGGVGCDLCGRFKVEE